MSLAEEPGDLKAGLFFEFLDAKFGRARFDEFMHGYFDHFALRSVTTEQFLAYLKENLLDHSPNIVSSQQVAAWVTGAAMPADAVLPASDAYAPIDTARGEWLAGRLPAKKLDAKRWVTPAVAVLSRGHAAVAAQRSTRRPGPSLRLHPQHE